MLIGLYHDVWIAAIAWSTASLTTQTAVICVCFQQRRCFAHLAYGGPTVGTSHLSTFSQCWYNVDPTCFSISLRWAIIGSTLVQRNSGIVFLVAPVFSTLDHRWPNVGRQPVLLTGGSYPSYAVLHSHIVQTLSCLKHIQLYYTLWNNNFNSVASWDALSPFHHGLAYSAASHGQPLPCRSLSPHVGGCFYVSPLKEHTTESDDKWSIHGAPTN